MNIDIAEKLSIKVNCAEKNSSGTIYVNGNTAYIFTAKHSICPKVTEQCQTNKRECNNCELINTYKAKITTISVDKVGQNNHKIKPKKVISLKDKDLTILTFKDKDLSSIIDLPNIKISSLDDIKINDKFITCGYPNVAGGNESQPIYYLGMSKFGTGITFQTEGNTVSNLESAKDNLSANSGAGIIKIHENKNLLLGIYTKTGEISTSFGEYIDHTVNDLLIKNHLPPLVFDRDKNEISTLIKSDFLKCFTKIKHLLVLGEQRKLNVFTVKLDGKAVNYEMLKERLNECIRLFSLPRKLIKEYEEQNKSHKSVTEGNKSFIALKNTNKVAELLLQGFLESHLKAPKLFSFIDGKNNNFQSVHIKLPDSMPCELVYSTAKMGSCLQTTLLNSLNDVLQGIPNLNAADSLVSNHLFDSTFDHKDQVTLENLLFPTEEDQPNNIICSFSFFIGFDFKCSDEILYKNIPEFNQLFQKEIIGKLEITLNNIRSFLDKFNIIESELNFYFVPFADTKEFCQSFLKGL